MNENEFSIPFERAFKRLRVDAGDLPADDASDGEDCSRSSKSDLQSTRWVLLERPTSVRKLKRVESTRWYFASGNLTATLKVATLQVATCNRSSELGNHWRSVDSLECKHNCWSTCPTDRSLSHLVLQKVRHFIIDFKRCALRQFFIRWNVEASRPAGVRRAASERAINVGLIVSTLSSVQIRQPSTERQRLPTQTDHGRTTQAQQRPAIRRWLAERSVVEQAQSERQAFDRAAVLEVDRPDAVRRSASDETEIVQQLGADAELLEPGTQRAGRERERTCRLPGMPAVSAEENEFHGQPGLQLADEITESRRSEADEDYWRLETIEDNHWRRLEMILANRNSEGSRIRERKLLLLTNRDLKY